MAPNDGDSLEFINLLAEKSALDLEALDTKDWSVVDRAAAFGTARDIQRLIELGASPFAASLPLQWNPLHHAVHFGNWSTFEYLLPLYGDTAIRMTDERGWTLLHIAAYNGQEEMCRLLLNKGFDPQVRSRKFSSHMGEALFDRALIALEVAKERGSETYHSFCRALLDAGCLAEMDLEDEDEFSDAQEYLITV